MRISCWFSMAFLLCAIPGNALESDASFEHLGREQGLSNSSVSGMVQDKEGFLWLSTQGGLNRWDGYRMKVWRQEPFRTNSLSHDQIQTLYLDRDQSLWLGTYGGLNHFDPQTGTNRVYLHDDAHFNSLSHNLVITILRDSHGRLWVGTLDGLNLLDEKTGDFTVFRAQQGNPRSLSSSTIRSLYEDGGGRVWVGTQGGLNLWDDQEKVFHRVAEDAKLPELTKNVMSIVSDRSGGLFLGMWDGLVVRYNPEQKKCSSIPLDNVQIYSLTSGDDNQIYVGTWGKGLIVLDPATGKSFSLRHDPARFNSLSHDVVYGTYRDRSGTTWVLTNGGGLDRYNAQKRQFKSVTAQNSSFPVGKVTAITRDSSNRIWAGVYGGGVVLLDAQKKVKKVFKSQGAVSTSLSSDVVYTISQDYLNRIWVGTNEGMNLLDEATGQFQRFKPNPADPSALPEPIIHAVLADGGERFWIGTYTQGLVHRKPLDQADVQNVYKSVPGNPHSLPDNLIQSLFRDGQGRVWVGTNGGLALYRPKTDDFQVWKYDAKNPNGLPSDTVLSFMEAPNSRLWIGSNGGLSLLDPLTGRFKNWGREEGLLDLSVNGMEKDASGTLWLTTTNGLYSFQPDKEIFRHYGVEDGLVSSEFYTGHCSDDEGNLILGNFQGLSIFQPASVKFSPTVPHIVMTDIEVVNQPHPVTASLNLNWWENSFSVEFSALDFVNPAKNQYIYKLEGFDKDWVSSGTRNLAVYTNLNPGNYHLRIKGSNSEELWTEMEVPLSVHVDPVPWLSWYAYLAYFLVAAGGIYLIQKVRVGASLRKKVQELEKVKILLEEANRQLDQLSRIDSLTGIPNRRALDFWIEKEWAVAQRERKPVALLMLDIDFFKRFNDFYGHIEGDVCLRTVATVIKKTLQRDTDFCARYGGEEFVVVLHDTDLEGGKLVAKRIIESVDALEIPHKMSSAASHVTVSIGVASRLPEPDVPSQELLHTADQLLYQAKSSGRHRIEA